MTEILRRLYHSATQAEREAGRRFYPEVHEFAGVLAGLSGCTMQQAAAVIAVTSPRASWDASQKDALALVAGADPAARVGFAALPRDLARAQVILQHEDPEAWPMRGPKVLSFYRNIVAPATEESIPLDRHLVRAATPARNDREITRQVSTPARYTALQERYFRAAEADGVRPIHFATAIWFVMRRPKFGQGLLFGNSWPPKAITYWPRLEVG